MAPRRSSAVTNEPPGLLEGATFTLDAPPPVHIPAHELLQTELQNLPTGVSKPSSSCATSREACVLCVHAFWYCYCSLRQPGSNFEQHALLKMMSEQMARLTLLVAAQGEDRDSFFTAYPPVLAHAVLSAMRKHSLLTGAPQASSVLRHIIALFGCTLPSKQLARHLELVQQRMRAPSGAIVASAPPAPAPSAAADARATCPPLSSNAVPPLRMATPSAPRTPSLSRQGSKLATCSSRGSLGGSLSTPQLAAGGEEEGWGGREAYRASLAAELGLGVNRPPPRSRPARVVADLRRTSPLMAMLTPEASQPLAASCSACSLGSLSYGAERPHYGVSRAASVRHSLPADDKCTLGGMESYKGKRDRGAVGRAAALRQQFEASQKEAVALDRQRRATDAEDARKLDVAQAEILGKPAAQLSEHTSALAAKVLHRDLAARYG